jgi:hypothetical protein
MHLHTETPSVVKKHFFITLVLKDLSFSFVYNELRVTINKYERNIGNCLLYLLLEFSRLPPARQPQEKRENS